MSDTVNRTDVLAAVTRVAIAWGVTGEAGILVETKDAIRALPAATGWQDIATAPVVPEGMGCICDACGERFADRLDHAATCQGPFPADWWNEDFGDVLWWCWEDGAWLGEAPYIGTPLDLGQTVEIHTHARQPAASCMVGGWPGYHTHWTSLPAFPGKPGDRA